MSGKTESIDFTESPKKVTPQAPAESPPSSAEATAFKASEVTQPHFNEQKSARKFPNFAYETILFGLKALDQKNLSARTTTIEIEAMQDKWESILQFQQKLAKLPSDKATHPITDEMRKDLAKLKSFGIDVLAEDAKEISADKLISLKSEIDSRKSKVQTDIQLKTVAINLIMQHCQSLIESTKHIVGQHARAIGTIINNMGKR